MDYHVILLDLLLLSYLCVLFDLALTKSYLFSSFSAFLFNQFSQVGNQAPNALSLLCLALDLLSFGTHMLVLLDYYLLSLWTSNCGAFVYCDKKYLFLTLWFNLHVGFSLAEKVKMLYSHWHSSLVMFFYVLCSPLFFFCTK